MILQELAEKLQLKVCAAESGLDQVVTGGYASDLLSNVMGKAPDKAVWVTMQTHANIVAVALLVGISGIIIAGDQQPAPDTLAKAEQEGIPVLTTNLPTFEVVGRLYQLGIKGV
jgi:serine kinase of HPr protein (carbohydrate metabolism regulator)